MRSFAVLFTILLLAACDAQPVIQSPLACQQRIVEVRANELLAPTGAANVEGSFRDLAARYSKIDISDCNDAQKRRIAQLEQQSKELARLAADATKAGQSASTRNTRLPSSEAHIAFMTALQDYENRQAQLKRELREMQQ